MTTQNLTRNILIGMTLGAAVGGAFNAIGIDQPVVAFFVKDLFPLVGSIFVRSLQLLVVPLVLCSLICGTRRSTTCAGSAASGRRRWRFIS